MREISPGVGVSVDEYLRLAPEIKPLVQEIRRKKVAGERLLPSASLIGGSQMLTKESRGKLLAKGRRSSMKTMSGGPKCVNSLLISYIARSHTYNFRRMVSWGQRSITTMREMKSFDGSTPGYESGKK
jgi:hypothetical protein